MEVTTSNTTREGVPPGFTAVASVAPMVEHSFNQAFGQTASAAERILACSQPTLYSKDSQSVSCSSLLQLSEMQGQKEFGVDRLSRSLTCLGLADTIPEEEAGMEEEKEREPPPAMATLSRGLASRSATDLVGMGFPQGEEDVFSSTGGLELDGSMAGLRMGPGLDMGMGLGLGMGVGVGMATGGGGPLDAGDRISPFKVGANPSRMLIVGNVSSAVSGEHLKALFETYGDVQSIRTEYKAHGVMVVSFYDLRSAFNAKRELEGLALADQALSVQFSASGNTVGNFGEGTLLIFNVDRQLDSQELARIFSNYGEVKRIQDVPDKTDHKLIEFYDIRHANAAMQAINKAVVASSKPEGQAGGMRQVASQQHLGTLANQEDDGENLAHSWDGAANAANLMKNFIAGNTGGAGTADPLPPGVSGSPSRAKGAPPGFSGMVKSTSFGSGLAELDRQVPGRSQPAPLSPQLAGGALPLTAQLAKGLRISDSASSLGNKGMYGRTPTLMQSPGVLGGFDAQQLGNQLGNQLGGMGLAQKAGLMGHTSTGVQPLTSIYGLNADLIQQAQAQQAHTGLGFGKPPVGVPPGMGGVLGPGGAESLLRARGMTASTSVGSGLDIYSQQSALNSALASLQQGGLLNTGAAGLNTLQGAAGGGLGANLWGQAGNVLPSQGVQQPSQVNQLAAQVSTGVNVYDALAKLQQAGVTNIPALLASQLTQQNQQQQQPNPYFQAALNANAANLVQQAMGAGVLPSLVGNTAMNTTSTVDFNMSKSASSPALNLAADESREQREHRSGGRLSRRNVDPVLEAERRSQQQRLYALDLDKVRNGDDKRTTLMIKNIPNKYTQKMLLASVDETLRGKYDFFYLPIDFKNKCNVGYGFINVNEPIHIIPLYERFHNKKWERFNSEKVCCITYARIQGKNALVNHFQNSSLMHEDKKHRPVLFVSEGPGKGEPEQFPVGPNVRPRITFKDRDFRSRERSGYWS